MLEEPGLFKQRELQWTVPHPAMGVRHNPAGFPP
jgi:hypothetical protein